MQSVLLRLWLAAGVLLAQPKTDVWTPLQFLIGEWTGAGTGQPGEGSGGFTFKMDLQNAVLVRTNYAKYPATRDRAAYTHQDLMVIYRDPTQGLRAEYFDSEGHVIRYSLRFDDGPGTVQFLSDREASQPRYRLTYRKTGADSVGIQFEIAPPGKPDAFATYIEAKAQRK